MSNSPATSEGASSLSLDPKKARRIFSSGRLDMPRRSSVSISSRFSIKKRKGLTRESVLPVAEARESPSEESALNLIQRRVGRLSYYIEPCLRHAGRKFRKHYHDGNGPFRGNGARGGVAEISLDFPFGKFREFFNGHFASGRNRFFGNRLLLIIVYDALYEFYSLRAVAQIDYHSFNNEDLPELLVGYECGLD